MGKILEQYYDYARKKGAYILRMRLAMLTRWPTLKIHSLEDNQANIKKVREALKELLNTDDIPDFR